MPGPGSLAQPDAAYGAFTGAILGKPKVFRRYDLELADKNLFKGPQGAALVAFPFIALGYEVHQRLDGSTLTYSSQDSNCIPHPLSRFRDLRRLPWNRRSNSPLAQVLRGNLGVLADLGSHFVAS